MEIRFEEVKMDAKEELHQLWDLFSDIREAIRRLQKYKGNRHYKKQYEDYAKKLNKNYKFIEFKIGKLKDLPLKEKFATVRNTVDTVLSDTELSEKLTTINNLELFWPELEIEFENLGLSIRSFEIPEEIPITESRLDLEEAIKDYDNGSYISALVMCRRAYEGALVELFRSQTKKDPVEEIKCKHCKSTIKEKAYLGISNLHDWAIRNSFVTVRLKQVGFLLTDMGAGAAHPPLTSFPRDKEVAKLGITATIALLKEISVNDRGGRIES